MSLYDRVAAKSSMTPDATAIIALDRQPLSYARLRAHLDYTKSTLTDLGIGRADRVAVGLPDGPDAAVAILGVAACAACAPFDLRSTASEFEDYLNRLHPAAILVPRGSFPAVDLARRHGVSVIEAVRAPGEAGLFALHASGSVGARAPRAGDDDVALILQTSGTSSQSKLVPLTHHNIDAAMSRVQNALELTSSDRYLNVTSFVYSQGLLLTFSSLAAGASVVCTEGFTAERFLQLTRELRPTWYSAAPTVHQAILAHARRASTDGTRPRFRLIRSAAAALPSRLREDLEEWFESPVIEAYGMTECYPISSNPLSHGARKPASAGLAAGTDIAILNEAGERMPIGSSGEIAVRGPQVMRGYLDEPPQADGVFTRGWFRTGDQGFLDSNGYLFVTGRIKEVINRGGQKIAPLEVEQVLQLHPAVLEAAVFPVPHATLGQEVAAAIVLRERASATERQLQTFAGIYLAPYKIPRRVVFLDDIPKSTGGKIQRPVVAERYNTRADLASTDVAAGLQVWSDLHQTLRAIWTDFLGVEATGVRDNFFDLGGNSLLALELLAHVKHKLGKQVPLPAFLAAPTIEQLADAIRQETLPAVWPELVPVKTEGSQIPFFWVHGDSSTWFLATHLGAEQPVYGLEHQSRDGRPAQFTTVETIAAHYLDEARRVQPAGPYLIGGFSFGGTIAFEMARQLRSHGERVGTLVLLDPEFPGDHNGSDIDADPSSVDVRRHLRAMRTLPLRDVLSYVSVRVKSRVGIQLAPIVEPVKGSMARACVALGRPIPSWLLSRYLLSIYQNARRLYRPPPYTGPVVYIKSKMRSSSVRTMWANVLGDDVAWREVPGSHLELITQAYAQAWIDIVKSELETFRTRASSVSSDQLVTIERV